MKIIIGCDEAAFEMKEIMKRHLLDLNHEVRDMGVFDTSPSLYPDTAMIVCETLLNEKYERGLLFCGTGIGMAITANKIPGIRAAVGHDLFSIERSVKSNDCQVLCMGSRVIAPEYAKRLLEVWLTCSFSGGASTAKVDRIIAIEKSHCAR